MALCAFSKKKKNEKKRKEEKKKKVFGCGDVYSDRNPEYKMLMQ